MCGADGSEIIIRMEAERERMVWVVWVHVHTVELANENGIYKLRRKEGRKILRLKALRDCWGEAPAPNHKRNSTTKIQQTRKSWQRSYKSLRSRRRRTKGNVILVHSQMLYKVVMPAKIFATVTVRASMSYMRRVNICATMQRKEPHVSRKYVYSWHVSSNVLL